MNELPHRCGAVQEFCIHENIKIVFCSVCRKVLGQKPLDTQVTVVTQVIVTDAKQKEYDETNLEKWV